MKPVFYSLITIGLFLSASGRGSGQAPSNLLRGDISKVMLENTTAINTPQLEFSPVFFGKGLVYVSSRRKSGARDKKIGETFFELFFAELDPNGNPKAPQSFSVNVNSQLHEGPVTFNRSGTVMYFTRNNMKQGVRGADSQGVSRLKIYEAVQGQYDWEFVKELPFNNDEYSTCHPALSPDGKRLYFASDMPGGYGGFDLYMAERVAEGWSTPINLGSEINTAGNDVFPFYHESGNLFFSSNGHEGMGGLDIFMINIAAQSWGEVTNLGVPFNSPYDDLGFILNPEGSLGFFTSDRRGGVGKDDIYKFTLPQGLAGINMIRELPAQIVVFDEATNSRIEGASIRIFERSPDGFILGNDVYDVQFMPVRPGANELVMRLILKNPEELGEPTLRSNSNGEASSKLKAEKSYFILVSKDGYAGGERIYSTVGENSAQTVRIGLSPQNCINLDGLVQNSQADLPLAQANVRIINQYDGSEEFVRSNSEGRFSYCLPASSNFLVEVDKPGFNLQRKELSTLNLNPNDPRSLELKLRLEPKSEMLAQEEELREGTIIILENIYYDFNKSAIRKGAARELDVLIELMNQYQGMEIELTAHTDSRGTEKYNMELSIERAEAAKKYLISRGISGSRITARGMGESQLRNDCADGVPCTDEQHQYNRRTEVRVSRFDKDIDVIYREVDPFGG
jgi:outer membrane protein OmpA-like peptidoglycan-associated protein